MARFERPKNTIENIADLHVGDEIWGVIGVWRPQMYLHGVVSRAPAPFREHPEYEAIHQGQADYLVYDLRWLDSDLTTMEYATDGNMQPGYSHNDNYWFRSKEDAEAARDYLQKQWEANPDLIVEEVERNERDERYDDFYEEDRVHG